MGIREDRKYGIKVSLGQISSLPGLRPTQFLREIRRNLSLGTLLTPLYDIQPKPTFDGKSKSQSEIETFRRIG